MTIEPAVAAEPSNADLLSPSFSAFIIIMYAEITAYKNKVQGINGSSPNSTDSDNTINPNVTKCAQSER